MKAVYKVYGISDCPACLRACALLMDWYPEEEYVFINCDFSKIFREHIKEVYNRSTFPIIIKMTGANETVIGGFDDLILTKENNVIYEAPPIRKPT